MVNMKLTPKEAKEYTDNLKPLAPEYPYGLRISLCEEDLAKLGITALPAVGQKLALNATAAVVSVSTYQADDASDNGRDEQRVELQITDMALAPASERSVAQMLYGG